MGANFSIQLSFNTLFQTQWTPRIATTRAMKNRDPIIASTHVHGHQELSVAFGFTQAALEKFHGFNHVHVAHHFA